MYSADKTIVKIENHTKLKFYTDHTYLWNSQQGKKIGMWGIEFAYGDDTTKKTLCIHFQGTGEGYNDQFFFEKLTNDTLILRMYYKFNNKWDLNSYRELFFIKSK